MITWRYHLLSLAAVFLALALGILVGISIAGSGAVETGSAGLVDDIQRDVDELRDQNNALSRERGISLRYQEDTFPYLLGTRLKGKKIALLMSSTTGEDIQRRLNAAILGAGGQVVSVTVLNARFELPALTARVKTELKADPQLAAVDDSSVVPVVSRPLAREIGKGGGTRVLKALQGTLVDSVSGKYDTPPDGVVLVTKADGGQAPAYADLEKNFLLNLKELAVPVVGCEPADAPLSEIPLFLSVDVSSVDNVDSRIGQVSLVYVLGGEKGAFGIKPTADMLIPILRNPR